MNIYLDDKSTKNQDGVLLVDFDRRGHLTKSIFSYNPRCDVIDSYRKLADFVCQVSR